MLPLCGVKMWAPTITTITKSSHTPVRCYHPTYHRTYHRRITTRHRHSPATSTVKRKYILSTRTTRETQTTSHITIRIRIMVIKTRIMVIKTKITVIRKLVEYRIMILWVMVQGLFRTLRGLRLPLYTTAPMTNKVSTHKYYTYILYMYIYTVIFVFSMCFTCVVSVCFYHNIVFIFSISIVRFKE